MYGCIYCKIITESKKELYKHNRSNEHKINRDNYKEKQKEIICYIN